MSKAMDSMEGPAWAARFLEALKDGNGVRAAAREAGGALPAAERGHVHCDPRSKFENILFILENSDPFCLISGDDFTTFCCNEAKSNS